MTQGMQALIKGASGLSEVAIKICVASNPHPVHDVPVALAHRPVVVRDPDGPVAGVPFQLLEVEIGVLRILPEAPEGLSRLVLDVVRERLEAAPEGGGCPRIHIRSGSSARKRLWCNIWMPIIIRWKQN